MASSKRVAIAKQRSSVPPVIPGLDEVGLTLRVPAAQFAFGAFRTAIRDRALTQVREDDSAVRGVLRGEDAISPFHAHFSVELLRKGGKSKRTSDVYVIRLDYAKGTHAEATSLLPVTKFLSELRTFFTDPDAARSGLLSSNFTLSLKEYTPTIKLPFSVPGALDHVPGLPQISGLDFSFAGASPAQPLVRAFVTTYSLIDEMIIRLLVGFECRVGPELATAMLVAAASHLPIFAKPTDETPAS